MKKITHFWSYLAQFFLDWEMFQTKVVEKIKAHILCSVTFLRKSCRLWDSVEKYGRAGQYGSCTFRSGWLKLHTHTHTHTHTLALCNTYGFSTTTMVERTRPNGTFYVHCLSCYSKYTIYKCGRGSHNTAWSAAGWVTMLEGIFTIISRWSNPPALVKVLFQRKYC